jgi:hypothetical protein
VDFLQKGFQPTFEELSALVTTTFGEIKERMLREDLHFLRDKGINGIPINIKVKGKKYVLGNKLTFHYQNLIESQRATLPLLFSVLDPFKEIPAVKALLENLIEVHKLDSKEVKQLRVVIGSNRVEHSTEFRDKIIRILIMIHQQVAMEFMYTKVDLGIIKPGDDDIRYARIYPLQLRIHQGRYYIIGVRCDKEIHPKNLQSFNVDRIFRGPDELVDEVTGNPIRFDWDDYQQKAQLSTYYDHCIGIYRDYENQQIPNIVYRWFRGWAASQVVAVPLHHSQQVVQTLSNGDIRIRLEVFKTPDLDNLFRKYGEFSWEG